MAAQEIAAALQRVEAVLRHRPEAGVHEDAPATARWDGGTRVVASHENGMQVLTDMPTPMGGSGDQVTPGWLFRAGLAACTTTCIAMAAAAEGIELTRLELRVGSRSDTRGLLGMAGTAGEPLSAGPSEVHLHVRIAARGVPAERLRALVERSYRHSPVACAVRESPPIDWQVEIADD